MPESVIKESWSKLAKALCGHWNVVAVDLHNGTVAIRPRHVDNGDSRPTLGVVPCLQSLIRLRGGKVAQLYDGIWRPSALVIMSYPYDLVG